MSVASIYDFNVFNNKGRVVPLSTYDNKVILIVNTASECGFTPQFAGLETLYRSVREKCGNDFVIIGFPCNQFGSQEPGTDQEIQAFCQINYGVTFPIMQKIEVNGDGAAPIYKWLKRQEERGGGDGISSKVIQWNFEKFLIGRDGKAKGHWTSIAEPESIEGAILVELAKTEK